MRNEKYYQKINFFSYKFSLNKWLTITFKTLVISQVINQPFDFECWRRSSRSMLEKWIRAFLKKRKRKADSGLFCTQHEEVRGRQNPTCVYYARLLAFFSNVLWTCGRRRSMCKLNLIKYTL